MDEGGEDDEGPLETVDEGILERGAVVQVVEVGGIFHAVSISGYG